MRAAVLCGQATLLGGQAAALRSGRCFAVRPRCFAVRLLLCASLRLGRGLRSSCCFALLCGQAAASRGQASGRAAVCVLGTRPSAHVVRLAFSVFGTACAIGARGSRPGHLVRGLSLVLNALATPPRVLVRGARLAWSAWHVACVWRSACSARGVWPALIALPAALRALGTWLCAVCLCILAALIELQSCATLSTSARHELFYTCRIENTRCAVACANVAAARPRNGTPSRRPEASIR